MTESKIANQIIKDIQDVLYKYGDDVVLSAESGEMILTINDEDVYVGSCFISWKNEGDDGY